MLLQAAAEVRSLYSQFYFELALELRNTAQQLLQPSWAQQLQLRLAWQRYADLKSQRSGSGSGSGSGSAAHADSVSGGSGAHAHSDSNSGAASFDVASEAGAGAAWTAADAAGVSAPTPAPATGTQAAGGGASSGGAQSDDETLSPAAAAAAELERERIARDASLELTALSSSQVVSLLSLHAFYCLLNAAAAGDSRADVRAPAPSSAAAAASDASSSSASTAHPPNSSSAASASSSTSSSSTSSSSSTFTSSSSSSSSAAGIPDGVSAASLRAVRLASEIIARRGFWPRSQLRVLLTSKTRLEPCLLLLGTLGQMAGNHS